MKKNVRRFREFFDDHPIAVYSACLVTVLPLTIAALCLLYTSVFFYWLKR